MKSKFSKILQNALYVDQDFFRCDCDLGFTGFFCDVEVQECDSDPCWNNGVCGEESEGEFECDCDDTGFTGVHCEIDVNECSSAPCSNGGVCMNQRNGYICFCVDNYQGENCEIDYDECESGIERLKFRNLVQWLIRAFFILF